jgi:carbon-monoxide dehydrogenase large subunit
MGSANFADDDRTARRTFAVFARCPHSHARIDSIDVQRACRTPGVLGVWTGQDLDATIEGALPGAWPATGFRGGSRPALASDRVRHVGEAVAIVVAETAHIARDAADRVEVDYRPLPAVGDAHAALAPGAPLLHRDAPGNLALEWRTGDTDSVAAIFAAAPHVVEQRISIPRIAAVALEPRACTATWEKATGNLTLRAPLQAPHLARPLLARLLGLPEQRIRVVSSDTGGAFGSRMAIGPEEIAVCFTAMRIGRPVHWTAVRREAFHSDAQGRDHEIDVAIAFDHDYRIQALRFHSLANIGAYASSFAFALPAFLLSASLPGPYTVPVYSAGITLAYTNSVPVGPVRGAGRQEVCFAIERLIDRAALHFGIDAVELRRRNLDSSAVEGGIASRALEQAAKLAANSTVKALGRDDGNSNECWGAGFALHVDACAPGPGLALGGAAESIGLYGRAELRVHATGKVSVFTDTTEQGQGHESMLTRVVVDALGVAARDVAIEGGDTAMLPANAGTLLGRGAAVSAQAVRKACQAVIIQATQIAAHHFGVPVDAITVIGSTLHAGDGSARSLTLAELAQRAYGGGALPEDMDRSLAARVSFDPPGWSRTIGAHCAVVTVDAETGNTKLLRYIAIDDVGTVFDLDGVRGMLEGGIVHGIGQIIMERVAYDENGQLLTTSLMDYALPRLDSIPAFEVVPLPSGAEAAAGRELARSAGSAGAIAAPAAIANAIHAALAPLGVTHIDPPLTPARIWEAIQHARGDGP